MSLNMSVKWTKSLQDSLDRMMKNLQKTRDILNAKVSRCRKSCETSGHPENGKA